MADGTSYKAAMKAAEKRLAEDNVKARHLAILNRAVEVWYGLYDDDPSMFVLWTERFYSLAHAAAFAVLPGKQSNKNAAKALDAAVKAVARKVRGWG